MRSGWVGSDVWDRVPNKTVFFGGGPSLRNMVESAKLGQQGRRLAMYVRPIQRQWTFNLPAKISLTTGNLIIICEDGLICFNSNLVQRTF